ncbi:MAG: hypothetical protein DELT_02044 [Desulfovibrio sp.]
MRRMRPFALLALFLCVSCAKMPETDRVPLSSATTAALWTHFTTAAERAENTASPFRLNATLYYSGKEDSQRVTTYFWGNGEKDAPYPLRLDILMGPGSIIATTREDDRGLYIYVPREETVYHAERDGLLAFGVPLPFKLKDLAAIVTGKFGRVFVAKNGEIPPAFSGDDGTTVYKIDTAPLAGYLTLSETGLPISWEGAWEDGTENGWRLTVEYWPDSTRKTPRKLHIEHAGEKREATLIARELAFLPEPFSTKQLELNVPKNTPLAPLDGAR